MEAGLNPFASRSLLQGSIGKLYLFERDQFLSLHIPYGQAPTVELDDGTILSQSGALIRYFGRKFDLYGATLPRRRDDRSMHRLLSAYIQDVVYDR